MLPSNDIKNLLNIKDEFISITQLKKKSIKGKWTNVVEGTLTYTPTACPNCGIKQGIYHYQTRYETNENRLE